MESVANASLSELNPAMPGIASGAKEPEYGQDQAQSQPNDARRAGRVLLAPDGNRVWRHVYALHIVNEWVDGCGGRAKRREGHFNKQQQV
jgi:hypothetical protein